jgi:hypothetical protein
MHVGDVMQASGQEYEVDVSVEEIRRLAPMTLLLLCSFVKSYGCRRPVGTSLFQGWLLVLPPISMVMMRLGRCDLTETQVVDQSCFYQGFIMRLSAA